MPKAELLSESSSCLDFTAFSSLKLFVNLFVRFLVTGFKTFYLRLHLHRIVTEDVIGNVIYCIAFNIWLITLDRQDNFFSGKSIFFLSGDYSLDSHSIFPWVLYRSIV